MLNRNVELGDLGEVPGRHLGLGRKRDTCEGEGIEFSSQEGHARQKDYQEYRPPEGGNELGILAHPRKKRGR